ncbi:MAG: hypothetical protein ACR2NL_09960, partial [Acidimicrobiia bacterium]
MELGQPREDDYIAYRAEIASAVLPTQVRVGAWVVLAVNVPFSVLDRLAFEGALDDFWVVRLALSLVCVAVVSALAHRFPVEASWFLAGATGGMLVSVLYWTGSAPTTEYY